MFAVFDFQENLLKTMMQIENTYFDLASSCDSNCLVICDRGTMDGSACELPLLFDDIHLRKPVLNCFCLQKVWF